MWDVGGGAMGVARLEPAKKSEVGFAATGAASRCAGVYLGRRVLLPGLGWSAVRSVGHDGGFPLQLEHLAHAGGQRTLRSGLFSSRSADGYTRIPSLCALCQI